MYGLYRVGLHSFLWSEQPDHFSEKTRKFAIFRLFPLSSSTKNSYNFVLLSDFLQKKTKKRSYTRWRISEKRQLTGKLLLTNLNTPPSILLLHFYFFWTLFFTVAFYVADDKDSRVDYIILFYLGDLVFWQQLF